MTNDSRKHIHDHCFTRFYQTSLKLKFVGSRKRFRRLIWWLMPIKGPPVHRPSIFRVGHLLIKNKLNFRYIVIQFLMMKMSTCAVCSHCCLGRGNCVDLLMWMCYTKKHISNGINQSTGSIRHNNQQICGDEIGRPQIR